MSHRGVRIDGFLRAASGATAGEKVCRGLHPSRREGAPESTQLAAPECRERTKLKWYEVNCGAIDYGDSLCRRNLRIVAKENDFQCNHIASEYSFRNT